jgi:hypothetical protein
MEVSGQFHVPAALHPKKQPRYPLYKMLGESQGRSAPYGEQKILMPLPRIKPQLLGRPAFGLVTILTELFRLP